MPRPDEQMIFVPRFALESNYLADYFGLWAIHEQSFVSAVEKLQGTDLRQHIKQASGDGGGSGYTTTKDGIAIIAINGPTMKFTPSMSEGTSTVRVRQQLKSAKRDESVKGVMLVMDTPGGTSKGNQDLADEVAALAEVKPVFAFVEDMTASAGVSVASQATKRFANNATAMYGAMGTYAVIQDTSGMAEKLGVKVHVVRAGDHKGAGVPGTEVTAEQLTEMQRIVDAVNESYLQTIAKGLKKSVELIRPFADGRIILASDAVSAGLIDGVQSFDQTYQGLLDAVSKPIQPTRKGAMQMEPATLQDLKKTFPNSSAEWRESQLEANATLSEAAIAYAGHVEAKATSEREQHKKDLDAAKNAKPEKSRSLGHVPLTSENVAGDDLDSQQSGDPIADFDSAVRAKLPKNREPSLEERQAAIAFVARTKPALHRSYIEAVNAGNKRVARLISEKYDDAA